MKNNKKIQFLVKIIKQLLEFKRKENNKRMMENSQLFHINPCISLVKEGI